MKDDLIKVNILGVNLTLRTGDDPTQLKQVIWFLNKKIDETRDKHKGADQLKLSILSNIYIVDELINLKNKIYSEENLALSHQSESNSFSETEEAFNRILNTLSETIDI